MDVIDKENEFNNPSITNQTPCSPSFQPKSSSHHHSKLSSPTVTPLSSKSMNSFNPNQSPLASPAKLNNGSPLRKKQTNASNNHSRTPSATSNLLHSLQKDFNKLERQYTELLMKNNNISNDYTQLEYDISLKNKQLQDQSEKLFNYEKILKNMENDYNKNKELLEQEIFYYKDLIEVLNSRIEKLDNEKQSILLNNESKVKSLNNNDLLEKYNKLLKDYKILQSNFEIEQNSKLVLIDQIEFLNKENESKTSQFNSPIENYNKMNNDEDDENHEFHYFNTSQRTDSSINDDESSIIHNIHHMNNIIQHDDSDSDNDSRLQNSHMLSYLVDDLQKNKLESSSPIKQSNYIDDESMEVSNNFQFPPLNKDSQLNIEQSQSKFPPSPDPQYKNQKRQSLPVKLKSSHASPLIDNEEFVLSPLKLTNANTTSFFDLDTSYTQKRYSNSKPNHSRYNSHDIVPIKVEFEPLELTVRSSSLPEREHQLKKFDIINEENQSIKEEEPNSKSFRNSAFYSLTGNFYETPSNRNSILTSNTNNSSKRSSLIVDNNNNTTTNDITKQEIMKLKFELQSLKLHNEKLLSYIGFELQKQKKNIKKLSNKQSLNDLRNQQDDEVKSPQRNNDKKIEYSDAKLIERSREMLIHKKRVLRSVSINPIMSKNYHHQNTLNHRNSKKNNLNRGIGIGLLPLNELTLSRTNSGQEELFSFTSDFINSIDNQDEDEDEYGFLKHNPRFKNRILSNGLNDYLNYIVENDEQDDESDNDISSLYSGKLPKKYKSQVFYQKSNYNDSSILIDADESTTDFPRDKWVNDEDDTSSDGTITDDDGVLHRIKSICFGTSKEKSHHHNHKRKKSQSSVDDNLKYKFLSIAFGIMLIGIRCSSYQQKTAISN